MTKDELAHWVNTWKCICSANGGNCNICELAKGGQAKGECSQANEEIRSLIESSGKRTVSRKQMIIWLDRLLSYPVFSPNNQTRPLMEICELFEIELCKILSELGLEVKE